MSVWCRWPVMGLAERAGRSELIDERVRLTSSRVASAGVNPAGKLTAIIAGMSAGAESIDDLDVIRSGGMGRLFGGVYAPATLGQLLREFTHSHTQPTRDNWPRCCALTWSETVISGRQVALTSGVRDRGTGCEV